MNMLSDIQQSAQRVDAILHKRDMAAAYHRITDEMGPSVQLMAFINHDQQLGAELGLESFETMDLDTQHVFLKTHLDVDTFDAMATEGLKEGLVKYRNWLLLGGIVVWPLLLAGIAGYALKGDADGKVVPSIRSFTAETKKFEAVFREDTAFTSAIPTSLDKSAWEKFDTDFSKKKKDDDDNSFDENKGDEVPFKDSGWNPGSYKNAAHWLIASNEKVKANDKARATKLEDLEKLLTSDEKDASEVLKYVVAMTSAGTKLSRASNAALGDVQNVLKKAGNFFEAQGAKKD
jgi:hypothetical protein